MMAVAMGKKAGLAILGTLSGVGAGLAYKLDQSVEAELTLHPPRLRWSHSALYKTFAVSDGVPPLWIYTN